MSDWVLRLIPSSARHFSPQVQGAGESLYSRVEIGLIHVDPERVVGCVSSGRNSLGCVVDLTFDAGDLVHWTCDSPQHRAPARQRGKNEQHGHPGCEHAWAVLLELEHHLLDADPDEALSSEMKTALRGARPDWDSYLSRIGSFLQQAAPPRWPRNLTGELQLLYWLDQPVSSSTWSDVPRPQTSPPRLEVWFQRQKAGKPSPPRRLDAKVVDEVSGTDLELLHKLSPLLRDDPIEQWHWRSRQQTRRRHHALEGPVGADLLMELAATGQLLWHGEVPDVDTSLTADFQPWQFRLVFEPLDQAESTYELLGFFVHGEERIALNEVDVIHAFGLFIAERRVARFEVREDTHLWISAHLTERPAVPAEQVAALSLELVAQHPTIPLDLPETIAIQRTDPKPRLVIRTQSDGGRSVQTCDVYFDYGDGVVVEGSDPELAIQTGETLVARSRERECEMMSQVFALGAQRNINDDSLGRVTVARSRTQRLVSALLDQGWSVEVEGKLHRTTSDFDIKVESGIDWFDVKGAVSFGEETIPFARLLGALRRGKNLIPLADGSVGALPTELLRPAKKLAEIGHVEGDEVRFRPSQGCLLDALLADLPEVDVDAEFARLRERLASFDGVEPRRERRSLRGTLRDYQRAGLAWLHFLREFQLGGCLADDMGLGKTVQVIAHLEELRVSKTQRGPVLIVAPRSVVEHWVREIRRFAPQIKVVDYSHAEREELARSRSTHVIVTTYAILRRDVQKLAKQRFDTVVLDEAQAIKNSSTQTAKAARLLPADHRLALSGTPVENHLGELWSLFEFLQPGMLGKSRAFKKLVRTPDKTEKGQDSTGLNAVARAVRPFLLRRTKGQVAPELPERSELVLECPLSAKQRALYDEVAAHLRASLLKQAGSRGLASMKLQVLEGLLRLRQIACHPGLVDPAREGESSSKLDVLVEHIEQLRDGGHRCLVFSQFTRFLALVKKRLDTIDVRYEYLDGSTRNRQLIVDRFQESGDSTAFLISLKAGGVGLNLTAADYVFLLDPWWNPAVEAQAIDRAHRIGQTQHVLAYRLIAPGTVEEKIQLMQAAKKNLADAIVQADESMLRDLTTEDLEFLLEGAGTP